MQEAPLEETLRRIIQEETQNAARQYAGPTVSQIREIIREELEPVWKRFDGVGQRFDGVGQRFDALDARLDRMGDALIIVAQWTAGSMPERESHVAKKVRRTLGRSGPPSPLAQAAKGGS